MNQVAELFARLVEEPPAPPAPIDAIRGRARHLRRRRASARIAAALVVLGAGTLAMQARQPERHGTVQIAGPGVTVVEYRSTVDAGFAGAGRWRLTVRRGPHVIEAGSGRGQECAPAPFIRRGDVVRAEILDEDSVLEVGPASSCTS